MAEFGRGATVGADQLSINAVFVSGCRLDQTGLGRRQQLGEHGEVATAGGRQTRAASMSRPITCPLGASRRRSASSRQARQYSASVRLRRPIGKAIQRQPSLHALAGLPLDRLDRAPGRRLRCSHTGEVSGFTVTFRP